MATRPTVRPATNPPADDVPARAEDAPGAERRKEVLSGIGKLLVEGWHGCLAEQQGGEAAAETETRDPNDPDDK